MIKQGIQKHIFFFLYLLVFGILLIGDTYSFGFKHTGLLLLFFVPYVLSYGFISRLKLDLPKRLPWTVNNELLLVIILGSTIVLIFVHLLTIGFPAFEGLAMDKISELAQLRKEIGGRSSWIWNYLSSITIKALLPFLLLSTFVLKKKKLYWIVFFVAFIYSISLMQKSHVLSIFIPVLIYCTFEKKWLYVFKHISTIGAVILLLVVITNPQLRGGVNDLNPELNKKQIEDPKSTTIGSSLIRRIMITPGEIVGNWFEIIPNQKPYLNGNGYGFYSRFSGEKFQDYTKELYPIIYRENHEKGLSGTVNVAHFMRPYSNFGKTGLILCGVFTALFIILLNILFQEAKISVKIAINFFPLMLLSSGSLLTILFSGGWFLFIFLYFLFQKEIELSHE